MIRYVDKVVAYVTRGSELLLFRHVAFPAAGIQVPAGTIDPGETPRQAAIREIAEESGLTTVRIINLLGVAELSFRYAGRTHFQRRHFYHALLTAPAPDQWRHWERHADDGGEYEFTFFWARFPDQVPPLAANLGAYLEALPRSPAPPSENPGV